MSSRIPTSTSVTESAVINAPLSAVWHLIKLQDFHHFWTKLEKSYHVKGTSHETDVVKWTFKDGTVLEVKQEEHSTIDHFISYRYKINAMISISLTIFQRNHCHSCSELHERPLHYSLLCCHIWAV